jgi:threonine dehydratase
VNFTLEELEQAQKLVRAAFPETLSAAWPLLRERTHAEVWVKHENHTPTGAFKVRGGLNFLDRLRRDRPDVQGIICATRGNHGWSLAYAAKVLGISVRIVVPHGNSVEKNAAMRAHGAKLIRHGNDFDEALAHARKLADEENLVFVPSFHRDLVCGVASWALELFRAAPPLDVLYVPIGLGSGICGAIAAREALGLSTAIVGVQSAGAPAYAKSFEAKKVIEMDSVDTHADGLAARKPDPEALDLILKGAARVITVSDDEIARAIRAYWADTHNLAEGAGAAALAGLLAEQGNLEGKRVGVVLSGGNIDLELFRKWVSA